MITQEKYDAAVDKVIKVSTRNGKKYYQNLGYKIQKIEGNNFLFVDLKDIKPSSRIKIQVRCPICKNTRLVVFLSYYKAKTSLCKECKSSITGKANVKDLTGQVFGRLTVLEPTEKRRGSSVIWKCKCSCATILEVSSTDLISGDTKSCGCLKIETHLKILREKGYFIKEDHTKEEVLEHLKKQSGAFKTLATFNKQIAKNRKFLCYFTCVNEWGNIDVHHIQGRQDFPNLTYKLCNLVCLRKDIHKEFHLQYGYNHNHVGQFYELLTLYARK